jgi:hypothetical protein
MLHLSVFCTLNFLPFPKKEEVVLHPERACEPGRTLHVISEREEHSSCYIAGSFGNSEIVKVVSDQEVFDCPDLYSTQEEADTRMILQALHDNEVTKKVDECLLVFFDR